MTTPTHEIRPVVSWSAFFLGLIVWTTVQVFLISAPLSQRNQLPEVDDSLAYLTRTKVMSECRSLDCRALVDLQNQFGSMSGDPELHRQAEIATFPFPQYHPLFSAIILSLDVFFQDLITTYRALWIFSPLLTGLAFAFFIKSLFGRTVAGITLVLAAFKVFPDTGLHYFTPSNLSLILAIFTWSRILSRNGSAPFALVFGSVLSIAIHPIGVFLSLISIIISFFLCETIHRRQLYLILSVILFAIAGTLIALTDKSEGYLSALSFHDVTNIPGKAKVFFENIAEAVIQFTRYKPELFGSLIVLFPTVILGLINLDESGKKKMTVILPALLAFLFISLFHSHVLTPSASLFFRLFIPFQLIIIGTVANLLYISAKNILKLPLQEFFRKGLHPWSRRSVLVSTITFAILFGYSLETIFPGFQYILLTREHMLKRQPLYFDREQPETLLAKAAPGDVVLYTSTMVMASFFIHDCMRLGALYYHPAFTQSPEFSRLLKEKNIRFAASYNPAVYHPSFSGMDEKDSAITSPEFTFSPLSRSLKWGPIMQEGMIPAERYNSIEIHPGNSGQSDRLKVFFINPGKSVAVEVVQQHPGSPSTETAHHQSRQIPDGWSGWATFPLTAIEQGDILRLRLPPGHSNLLIKGISFDDKLFWPWSNRTTLVFESKEAATGTVRLKYDPANLLPPELQMKPVTVIQDQGSSVLMEFPQ